MGKWIEFQAEPHTHRFASADLVTFHQYDPDEEAARAQALKEERLANAELMNTKPTPGMGGKASALLVYSRVDALTGGINVSYLT